jgi:hypothetical protein
LFYEPIFYLDPNAQFPQPNMLPGRFLGIAWTTGDEFTFYVLAEKEPGRKGKNIILTQSVIQKQSEEGPCICTEYPKNAQEQ